MSTTADNSWDACDDFSMPSGEPSAIARCELQANILGVENRQEHRYPDLSGCPAEEIGISERIENSSATDVINEQDAESAEWSKALSMWLEWSSTYEDIISRMFHDGEDTQRLEALMDEMDQLRHEAVELSEGLIDY